MTEHSDAGEAQTWGPSVLSQALYHWATVLPMQIAGFYFNCTTVGQDLD